MDDLISRQEAIELCDWYEHDFCECDYVIKALADDLKSLPTASPRKGRWVEKPNVFGVAYCSVCDYELHTNDTNFCPNCGARMEE